MMAGVVRWFKSAGGAALTKSPLKSHDEGEGEYDHEMVTAPRSPQRDLDGIIILCYASLLHILCAIFAKNFNDQRESCWAVTNFYYVCTDVLD